MSTGSLSKSRVAAATRSALDLQDFRDDAIACWGWRLASVYHVSFLNGSDAFATHQLSGEPGSVFEKVSDALPVHAA